MSSSDIGFSSCSSSDFDSSESEFSEPSEPSEPRWSDDVALEVGHFKSRKVQDPVILAVLEQDLDSLIELCGGTEWYKYIQPETGNSLLHISVLYGCERVFQRLSSIRNFPFDHRNKENQTALYLCLYRNNDKYDDFAYELIRNGASVDDCAPLSKKQTLLHYTIDKWLVKTSKLLMENGYDLNARCSGGRTPLWLCIWSCISEDRKDEMATALLCYGADASLVPDCQMRNTFDYAVRYCSETLQEALFYYMIDEYDVVGVHVETLLLLAEKRSPLFQGTIQCVKDVLLSPISKCFCYLIFSIELTYLDSLIKRYPDAMREVLSRTRFFRCKRDQFSPKAFLENINFLLESDLKEDAKSFIYRFSKRGYFQFLISEGVEESFLLEHVCFFLSYGVELNATNMKEFYARYGYSDLLRIVLHTDIKPFRLELFAKYFSRHPFLILLLNTSCDLQLILDSDKYAPQDLNELIYYFADPKLRAVCRGYERPEIVDMIGRQPNVPLLVELARNVFRKSCGRKFPILRSSRFYAFVNSLPIASFHKKIITLGKKLYY